MHAPVVNLTGEHKDHIHKLAFIRMIEAYKRIAVDGRSQLRFSLLSYSGVEIWLDLAQKAKEGGVDVIRTIVFYNGHEPQHDKVK
ncbi:hypothetical protein L1987_23959 [Smallanthus sonchifolius]|uniref:Uncharacterized protein n=1 Tax=Smallanthus sonchifolius TaxID=185202 RepID=A0ACB9IK02_9ASTR|nr:hypothetical protein L1987_23959 [Smallanthus sonchifolius]